MSHDADLYDPDPYIPFATNDAELAFGRSDPVGENASWQSVRVVISELWRDRYGLIIAATNCRGPVSGPIVSSVIDEFFIYESSEFSSVVFLTLFGPVHLVGTQGLRMMLRFRLALEFHECVRFLAEAKSQLTCMRDRLLEQLGLVYDRHFSATVNLLPPTTAMSHTSSAAEGPTTGSATQAQREVFDAPTPVANRPSPTRSPGGDVLSAGVVQ
ncbi:hypothetical protein LXA43DRAFT_1065410 [Ganoderma leucocontextum]|nr:hypothetical protein LXA43DRAFT_1065410 [Ganoderma leucocontextum]